MTPAITAQHLASLPVGNCIQCLGSHANHTLELKFAALQRAGYTITEFSFAEYYRWVRARDPTVPDTDPESFGNAEPSAGDESVWEALWRHAPEAKALAAKHGVKMISLQCLGQVCGWPAGSRRAELGRKKAENWLLTCKHLGLEICQVGVNDQYDAVGTRESTVEDMRWLAQRGEHHGVKIAFESWNFAPRNNEWEATWEIVQAVNHPYLGLCIDTAQCALAPAYGYDPTSGNGYTEPAFQALLSRLRSPSPPLLLGSAFDEWHKAQGPGYRTGFTWCRCARVIPHIGRGTGKLVKTKEDEGAGRVAEVVKAILQTGFTGPLFFECFEVSEQEKPDESIPDELAQASVLSWKRLSEAMVDK
ncbi:hypothetical protein EHS25_003550 [Saitozyma podzolica]|uniref:Xylose isomerase-like TIM barrel domain-containing protein n=1 Tax=Saitozyma podzolica TaxID=1890683 RepID=A0A427Y7J8_9TREE|nr:hypothetical protein EHS25_003550 [Saitozyma podzolica]